MTEDNYNREDWRKAAPGWFVDTVKKKVTEGAPDWMKDILNPQEPEDMDSGQSNAAVLRETDDFETNLASFVMSAEAPRYGYNSWFGRGTKSSPPNPFKEPTQMSLDEVIDWQTSVREQGAVSSAVGGYQIIYKTLLDAKRKLGLSGSEQFNQELQDRIFSDYLVRIKRSQQGQPTIDDFLKGRVTKEEFGNSLAKEWAGLPVLRTTRRENFTINPGDSYYRGVGSNNATVSLQDFSKVLTLVGNETEEEEGTS